MSQENKEQIFSQNNLLLELTIGLQNRGLTPQSLSQAITVCKQYPLYKSGGIGKEEDMYGLLFHAYVDGAIQNWVQRRTHKAHFEPKPIPNELVTDHFVFYDAREGLFGIDIFRTHASDNQPLFVPTAVANIDALFVIDDLIIFMEYKSGSKSTIKESVRPQVLHKKKDAIIEAMQSIDNNQNKKTAACLVVTKGIDVNSQQRNSWQSNFIPIGGRTIVMPFTSEEFREVTRDSVIELFNDMRMQVTERFERRRPGHLDF